MRKKYADEALDLLVQEGTVSCKEYGKAKVFLVNQNRFPEIDTTILEQLDDQINVRRDEYNKLAEQVKVCDKELKECTSSMTNETL